MPPIIQATIHNIGKSVVAMVVSSVEYPLIMSRKLGKRKNKVPIDILAPPARPIFTALK